MQEATHRTEVAINWPGGGVGERGLVCGSKPTTPSPTVLFIQYFWDLPKVLAVGDRNPQFADFAHLIRPRFARPPSPQGEGLRETDCHAPAVLAMTIVYGVIARLIGRGNP